MSDSLRKSLEDLLIPGPSGSDIKNNNTPEAWRPRMEIDEISGGFVISKARPAEEIPDAKEILKEFNLNPEHWSVSSVRRSRWQTYNGDWLEAARINIVPISLQQEHDLDLEKLVDEIKKWRPKKVSEKTHGELAFVFSLSDQQIGKKGSGQGTEESVKRLLEGTELGLHRLKELRKIGRNVGTTVLSLLGDHVEGIVSQGGRLQSHSASDMGLTEQIRISRRLLMAQIKVFAEVSEKVIVPVVNGNHDEVTRQVSVDPAEGWNTEIASAVQDACRENDALSHVEFRFPEKDHQTLAININGTMLGLFHGHQVKGGDAVRYLSGQSAGQTALGNCDVWLSGHFHHYKTADIGPRFWAQCPTVDPGSAWFRDRTGMESPAGILTMVIGDGYDPRRDLSILKLNR